MATTTNYGWVTPNDTDLVKDGASAIRTLGQSIDTTFAELKGGTSGQMLTKASNTDNDYTWVTPQIGDITAITATSPLTGGGTTGDVTIGIQAGSTTQSGALQLTDSTASTSTTTAATPNSVKSAYDLANAAIPKSTATTAGDLLYRNGTTVTRLGIGTAGQILQVNSGATAPEWAAPSGGGGITLLATGTLNNSSNVVSFTSISGSYKNIYLVGRALETSSGSVDSMYVRVNNTSGTSYGWSSFRATGGSTSVAAQGNQDAGEWGSGAFYQFVALSGDGTMYRGDFNFVFPNYSNGDYKAGYYNCGKSGSQYATNMGRLNFNSTSAISRIDFFLNSGSNWKSGQIYLYGEN